MRKVIALEHVSLDGYLSGPNGEMDWIRLDDEMWDVVKALSDDADTAVFGRVTYQMMAGYWPTAGDQPNATQQDIDHSRWVNNATKIVPSRTLETAPWGKWDNVQLIKGDLGEEMRKLKQQAGKTMLLIGSVDLVHSLVRLGLIDEFQLQINPVVLGRGKPLFPDLDAPVNLELVDTTTFPSGVIGCRYRLAGQM